MAQAVDGNWYGYFADKTQASIADFTAIGDSVDNGLSLASATAPIGQGLDFGEFCTAASAGSLILDSATGFTDTVGVALPANVQGGSNGTSTGAGAVGGTCLDDSVAPDTTPFITNSTNNVVREAKDLNIALVVNNVQKTGQLSILQTDTTGIWPFIQLYSLNPTGNVIVQYNKGGGVQSTTLTFDTVDNFASASLDKSIYTRDSQVHITVTDLWLNIDPTDEDSWTFGTNATAQGTVAGSSQISGLTTNYQVFNENGLNAGSGVVNGIIDISGNMTNMMIEDNGVLILNPDTQSSGTAVLTLQDTDDTILTCTTAQDASTCLVGVAGDGTNTPVATNGLKTGSQPITLTEQGPNTGVFGTYDESDTSVVVVTSSALRGTSATIDYNETPVTVLVGFDFGTIDMTPVDDEWNSGEEISVTLTDNDANKNSRADEDLDLNNPAVTLIPSLVTGDPFTLRENTTGITVSYGDVSQGVTGLISGLWFPTTTNVTSFSDIARIQATSGSDAASIGVDSIVIDTKQTFGSLRNSIGDNQSTATDRQFGFNLLNLDVRSFNNTGTFNVYTLNATTGTPIINETTHAVNAGVGALNIASGVKPQSLTNLNGTNANGTNIITQLFDTAGANGAPNTDNLGIWIQHVGDTTNVISATDAIDPIVVDFFSFGFTSDGLEASQRVANQIVRLELEESGDNTGTFIGSLEYTMLNQLNILDANTYTGLSPIADDPTFIVMEDLTDEDAPRVNYLDLGSDGVSTQIADQEEAPSHSGVVSFDSNNYKTADTVTITLEDLDLNADNDLIDIYTTVTTNADQNQDAIGSGNVTTGGTSITLTTGEELGRLLDVTFDDVRWQLILDLVQLDLL